MVQYFGLANMDGYEEATERTYFYCGGSQLMRAANAALSRLVYEIIPSDDRYVLGYKIINDCDIPLEEVLGDNKKHQKTK